MNENYSSAAKRHWNDGETLTKRERLDNADQLFGFSAECALKSALNSLGRFQDIPRKHKDYARRILIATNLYRG